MKDLINGCVVCGDEIPEVMMVCSNCQKDILGNKEYDEKEITAVLSELKKKLKAFCFAIVFITEPILPVCWWHVMGIDSLEQAEQIINRARKGILRAIVYKSGNKEM